MNCPKCGSPDWKSASLVHKEGVTTTAASTVGLGGLGDFDNFTPAIGFGKTFGSHQTEISRQAAPPSFDEIHRPITYIVGGCFVAFIFFMFLASRGNSGINTFFAWMSAISLIIFIGSGIYSAFTKSITEEYKKLNKIRELEFSSLSKKYLEKRMCLRCGTFYEGDSNSPKLNQSHPSPSNTNNPNSTLQAAPTKAQEEKILKNASDLYSQGKYTEALLEWFKLAKNGHGLAASHIGDLYSNGLGVPQDYREAIRWLKIAAENGDTAGQISYGLAFFRGNGVKQDPIEALIWFKIAAKKRNPDAIKYAEMCENMMTPEQVTIAIQRAQTSKS